MHYLPDSGEENKMPVFVDNFFFLQGLLLARLRDEQLVKKQAVLLSILAGLLHYAPAPAPQGVSVCTFVPVCAS